jgi:hypothetical protein
VGGGNGQGPRRQEALGSQGTWPGG